MPENFPVASRGYQEHMGIGREKHPNETATAAYGTAVTATDFLRNVQFNAGIDDDAPPRPSPSLAPVEHWTDGTDTRDIGKVPIIRPSIQGEADFHVFPLLLLQAMRVYGDTGKGYTVTGAADPYTHTAKYPTAPQAPPHAYSLTRYAGRENLREGGVYVETLTLRGEAEGPLMFTAECVAQNYLRAPSTPGTPSFVEGAIARMFETDLRINATGPGQTGPLATTYSRKGVRSFELTIAHTLRVEPHANVQASSGSCKTSDGGVDGRGIARPISDDWGVITLAINTDWANNFYQDEMRVIGAGNYVTLEFLITAAAVSNRTYLFRLPAAKVMGPYPAFGGGPGPINEEATFKAGAFDNSGTLEIFEGTIVNGHSGYFPTTGF